MVSGAVLSSVVVAREFTSWTGGLGVPRERESKVSGRWNPSESFRVKNVVKGVSESELW